MMRALALTTAGVIALGLPVAATTTEREGVESIAVISDEGMEALAAILVDSDVSGACRGYADLLLLFGAYVRHILTFPDSRLGQYEFSTRIAPSLAAAQYRCEIAA